MSDAALLNALLYSLLRLYHLNPEFTAYDIAQKYYEVALGDIYLNQQQREAVKTSILKQTLTHARQTESHASSKKKTQWFWKNEKQRQKEIGQILTDSQNIAYKHRKSLLKSLLRKKIDEYRKLRCSN